MVAIIVVVYHKCSTFTSPSSSNLLSYFKQSKNSNPVNSIQKSSPKHPNTAEKTDYQKESKFNPAPKLEQNHTQLQNQPETTILEQVKSTIIGNQVEIG